MSDGIRSKWAAEAEISFSTYRNADEARRGIGTWSHVCQDTQRKIDEARAANRFDKANVLVTQLSGYRMLLEDARAKLAELTALEGKAE